MLTKGGHLIGQPFTVADVLIPVSLHLTCNCGLAPDPVLRIINSAPATCAGCHKTYIVHFNPQSGLQVAIASNLQQVPS